MRPRQRWAAVAITIAAAAGMSYAAEEYHQDYHAKNGGSCALPEE